jgi:propanediol dehydratase small subunit
MNSTRTKTTLLRKTLHGSLLGLVLLGAVPAQAALVDNQQLAQQAQVEQQRDAVRSLLAREDVRAALLEQGVSEASVEQRVNQLTAEELQQMHARLAELPAGADSGVGLVLGIIFIFIILDLLGATDIFPRI